MTRDIGEYPIFFPLKGCDAVAYVLWNTLNPPPLAQSPGCPTPTPSGGTALFSPLITRREKIGGAQCPGGGETTLFAPWRVSDKGGGWRLPGCYLEET